jgi:hypothetical protein
MNRQVASLLAASALTIPAISMAQSTSNVSRAEVRQEIRQLESAGFQPNRVSPAYPADLEAARARLSNVRSTNNAVRSTDNASFGGVDASKVQSGS